VDAIVYSFGIVFYYTFAVKNYQNGEFC